MNTTSTNQPHTIERGGCRIHYWLAGPEAAPLVACTHGATADHHMFEAQVAALAPDCRVLTWDVRGHGQSRPLTGAFTLPDCADDLIAILDGLGVRQAVLLGQSMGAYISQYAYLRHPERVSAMVIIGATCIALPYARWEVLALKATMPLLGLWPYEHLKRTVAHSAAVTPAARDYMLRTIGQLSREEFLAIWKPVTLAVDEKGIPGHHIRVPLLLTHGDRDNLGSIRRQAPAWAAYEPDVRYAVIPDAGHNANQDNPEYFNRLLLEFLRQVPDPL